MTYNIHHGRNADGVVDLARIAEIIKNSGADIVGLQEVDSVCGRSGNIDQMKVLAELTGMYHSFKKHFAYDGGAYGLGILSVYPLTNVKGNRISSFSKDDKEKKTLVFLTADLKTENNRILHFGTVHFDYRKDPQVRLKQAAEVIKYIHDKNQPVILTGDLNTLPNTEEMGILYKVFNDTDQTGKLTFPAADPIKKIDYILVSQTHLKKVIHHIVLEEPAASDHRPVITAVKLKK